MSNKIIKRIYYAFNVKLLSPLTTSSGESEYTDSDLLRNSDGQVFVPGTTIAGALRARLTVDKQEKLTGYSKGEDSRMSSLYVSDLFFEGRKTSSVRDGIKLNEDKSVNNKFDMEVLETGAVGTIYINYIIRENDTDMESVVRTLITDIQNGYIRFGANKNRGYGRMSVELIYRQEFSKASVDELLDFDPKAVNTYKEKYDYETWIQTSIEQSDDYVKIIVPLKLTGGISIRKYSVKPNEADYEQLTLTMKDVNGNPIPIVPGTSWNGAIRSNVLTTLKALGDPNAYEHVEKWFGYVDLKGKKAQQSIVIFGESLIEDSKSLTMTRNKINRFDASTIDTALYTEKSYFEGKTSLEIMIKKDEGCNYEALIGLLQIAIKDIENGYLAIGGQTAVGRGIFTRDDSQEVKYENAISPKGYAEALYRYAMEVK